MHIWIIFVLIALLIYLIRLFLKLEKSIFRIGFLFASIYLALFTAVTMLIYEASLHTYAGSGLGMGWLAVIPFRLPIADIARPIDALIPTGTSNWMFNNFYRPILTGFIDTFIYFCIGSAIGILQRIVFRKTR